MPNLVRLIYISRSAAPAKSSQAVDPVVARILAKSRANNRKNGLVGVLYFGDGCFFQCLEGEAAAVDTLYAKLEQDPRHRDLKVISRTPIGSPTFEAWSMKYVPIERDVAALLQRHGMRVFDPYQFNAAITADMLDLLHKTPEAAPDPAPPRAEAALPASGKPAPVRSRLPLVLLAVAVLAVAGVLIAMAQRA